MNSKKTLLAALLAALMLTSGCGSSASGTQAEDGADSGVSGAITVISREDGSGTRGAFIELTGVEEKTADGKLDSYVGKKVKMGIRPEDIDDEPEFMAKHTDCQLDAQVDVSEMMGAEIYLYLEYKGNKMTARVAPTSKARNGDKVRVAFDPHKVHVFDVETEQTILN